MNRVRWLPMVLAIPLVVVLGAGCGGGKQQVTAAELVQKADQACGEEQDRFREIQATPPTNASEATDQTKALVQAAENASSALGDLNPPDALRTQFDTYLSARDRAIDQMKKGQDAAENQDSRAYGAAQAAVTKSSPQRKKLAGSLGFRVCSRNAGAA
jgi:argininosuccinate lyase